MNIVIIEGPQTLPHTISLLKVSTDSYYTLCTRGAKPISIDRPFHEEKNPSAHGSEPPYLPLSCGFCNLTDYRRASATDGIIVL